MSQPLDQQIMELKKSIAQVNVVSFDFFDTLFVRPLCHAEDVFDILGKKFNIENFREIRRESQAKAFRNMHDKQRKEITLADIYQCFPSSTVSSEELMRAEYDLELRLVVPNPELIEIFNDAVDSGKKVVVTSDMYLTEDFFINAFDRNNLKQVPMFISASKNSTKRDNGELFDILSEELGVPHESILHIGDNEHADVKQALAKNLQAFHYRQDRVFCKPKNYSPEASIASGLIQTTSDKIPVGSAREYGFRYAGPAAFGFLKWIENQSRKDEIDHILFMSRDGFLLSRIVSGEGGSSLPVSNYFLGSRIAFTLAAITESNFTSYLPFLMSGSDGLSPFELLERIGVAAPSAELMESFGLSDQSIITLAETHDLQRFLYAYRWEILKVCKRNRQALFNYMLELGIDDGKKIAIVDVGWSGSTQEAFELAVKDFMKLDIYGYYFCLADTPECLHRRTKQRMSALVSAASIGVEAVNEIYKNRVTIETFFTAPHHTVIGLMNSPEGVVAIEDSGRGADKEALDRSEEIVQGGEDFYIYYDRLIAEIGFPLDYLSIANLIVEFSVGKSWRQSELFSGIHNFDTWASTKNKKVNLSDYV